MPFFFFHSLRPDRCQMISICPEVARRLEDTTHVILLQELKAQLSFHSLALFWNPNVQGWAPVQLRAGNDRHRVLSVIIITTFQVTKRMSQSKEGKEFSKKLWAHVNGPVKSSLAIIFV